MQAAFWNIFNFEIFFYWTYFLTISILKFFIFLTWYKPNTLLELIIVFAPERISGRMCESVQKSEVILKQDSISFARFSVKSTNQLYKFIRAHTYVTKLCLASVLQSTISIRPDRVGYFDNNE